MVDELDLTNNDIIELIRQVSPIDLGYGKVFGVGKRNQLRGKT